MLSYWRLDSDTSMAQADAIMANLSSFENRLRDSRMQSGWSQEELARRLGLSRTGISAIETGQIIPSAAAALGLAAALGCRGAGTNGRCATRRPRAHELDITKAAWSRLGARRRSPHGRS
jgi:transcriptional regulator with XRE-family HTH domain